MSAPPCRVAIVGCGKNKAGHACRAAEMYTGPYFSACLAAARAQCEHVFILSAKYGLLRPSQRIEPYDLRLGQPGSVSAGYVREQAGVYRIRASRALVLAGAEYARLIIAAWPDGCVDTPLAHLGIGLQRQKLAVLARG